MRMVRRVAISASIFVGAIRSALATDATLVGDTHVSSTRPTVNYGTLSNVSVASGTTGLLQFDLSTLPANTSASQVSKATLRLYVNRVFTPGSVNVLQLASAWNEATVNYMTLPALGANVGSLQVSSAGQYVVLDVTAAVQGWITSPDTNHGFALSSSAASVLFDSKENDETGHPASLDVTLGSQGSQGSVGPTGPTGASGPTGPTGPQGITGATGAIGPIGPAGATGPTGANGTAGAAGPTGPAGVAGATGPAGVSGQTGATGLRGATGPTGSTGAAGATGATGAAGPTGATGIAGATGPAGVAGPTGATGLRGATGSTGSTGPAGTTGATGPTGSAGATGPAGAAGTTGPAGATGPAGVAGPTGPQGVTGPQGSAGPQGSTGPQGVAGPQGSTGPQGLPGAQGSTGPQGPTGVSGSAGPAGAPGAPGSTGSTGPTGATGPAGAAGGQIYSANIAGEFGEEETGTYFALPIGQSYTSGATYGPVSQVLAVPASCVASGFQVTGFGVNYSGVTGASALLSVQTGDANAVANNTLTTTPLACAVFGPQGSTGTATVGCGATGTQTLIANQFVSIQIAIDDSYGANSFTNTNFLVSFVCR